MGYSPTAKHVWITGASSGIGKALVRTIAAKKPAALIISARSNLDTLADECIQLGAERVYSFTFDLGSAEETEEAIRKFASMHIPLDLLINNAGVSQRSLARNTDSTVTEQIMRVNCIGAVRLTKGVLPHLLQQAEPKLVTISSIAYIGITYRSSYAAAKAGLEAYMKSLALEENNLSVSIVRPGFVRTAISQNALEGNNRTHGVDDASIAGGKDPQAVAERILKNIGKREYWVAVPFRFHLLRFIRLLCPPLANAILRSVNS